MNNNQVIALILAGGQGSRLGKLTENIAKPAVLFGSKYRIIDFTLSNCSNSGIYNVGVLTQYKPLELIEHIGSGECWGFNSRKSKLTILSPYQCENGGEWYSGTANAVYQNISFIERYNPENVIILSGDHIYRMDYSEMIKYHRDNEADVTISVMEVDISEASRFGIMNVRLDNTIYQFEEKPSKPQSNKASMGIYVFKWSKLKEILIEDNEDIYSDNDFGKNIIPKMLEKGERLIAFPYKGYWRDVGTVESYWRANMDLLDRGFQLEKEEVQWPIYSAKESLGTTYIAEEGKVINSILGEGCKVFGQVQNCIIFNNVFIGKGCYIKNTVIMNNVEICDGTLVENAIIQSNTSIKEWDNIGDSKAISIIKA